MYIFLDVYLFSRRICRYLQMLLKYDQIHRIFFILYYSQIPALSARKYPVLLTVLLSIVRFYGFHHIHNLY